MYKTLIPMGLLIAALTADAHHETPCLSDEPDACECVTAECVIGRPPAEAPEVTCEVACNAGSAAICFFASLKVPKANRKEFLISCNAGKTASCMFLCD